MNFGSGIPPLLRAIHGLDKDADQGSWGLGATEREDHALMTFLGNGVEDEK